MKILVMSGLEIYGSTHQSVEGSDDSLTDEISNNWSVFSVFLLEYFEKCFRGLVTFSMTVGKLLDFQFHLNNLI